MTVYPFALDSENKICSKCKVKKQYLKRQELCKKNARKYYYKNINKCRKAIRKYQSENREKMREASNRWKRENPDKVKQYIENNRDLYAECSRKRRAKINATINEFTTEELNQRMSVFGNKCAYCKGPFEHVDHVIPLSKGGPHCLANLKPACKNCNLSKHAQKLNDWLKGAA